MATVHVGPPPDEVSGKTERYLEPYRAELTGYCYRMLGSAFEAEDAVQETMVRAWRGLDRFEGRSSLRSWLYRIATNVCIDMLGSGQRRARPMDLGSPSSPDSPVSDPLPEAVWIGPAPDARLLPSSDPAEAVASRDSVRLAFVAALQQLPPRQRAVLILRDVLSWSAREVADLLDTSAVSVNSALQRARATMGAQRPRATEPASLDDVQRELLSRYVDAFERYDMDALTSLLHEDATMTMPPLPLWLRGPAHIRGWMLGQGSECRGSRLVPAPPANGAPAFGQYRASGPGGRHEPWALVVLELSAGRVGGITSFLDTDRLFPLFGLPPTPAR